MGNVRTFNVSDLLTLGGGGIGSMAAHTMGVLFYPTTLNAFKDYVVARASVTTIAGMFTGGSGSENQIDDGADAGDSQGAAGVTTGAWQWLFASKAAGNTAARLDRSVLGSGSWIHATGTPTYTSAATAITAFLIGAADSTGTAVPGDYAIAFEFNRQISTVEAESFVSKTSDIWNASGGRPKAIWELNQASTATSVLDITGGGADQTALSGTTVSTTNDPPGFTFDGLGSIIVPAPPAPHRMPIGV